MSFLLIKSHLVQILQRIDMQCFVSKGQRKMKVLDHSFSSSRSCPVDAVYWIILDVWPNTSPMPSSFMKMSKGLFTRYDFVAQKTQKTNEKPAVVCVAVVF